MQLHKRIHWIKYVILNVNSVRLSSIATTKTRNFNSAFFFSRDAHCVVCSLVVLSTVCVCVCNFFIIVFALWTIGMRIVLLLPQYHGMRVTTKTKSLFPLPFEPLIHFNPMFLDKSASVSFIYLCDVRCCFCATSFRIRLVTLQFSFLPFFLLLFIPVISFSLPL